MVARDHGMVVTVASLAGYTTTPNIVDYSATKAAAISFHEGLAVELVTRYHALRVRIVLLTQGYTQTALIGRSTPEDTRFNPLRGPATVVEELARQMLAGNSGHVGVPGSLVWIARNEEPSALVSAFAEIAVRENDAYSLGAWLPFDLVVLALFGLQLLARYGVRLTSCFSE